MSDLRPDAPAWKPPAVQLQVPDPELAVFDAVAFTPSNGICTPTPTGAPATGAWAAGPPQLSAADTPDSVLQDPAYAQQYYQQQQQQQRPRSGGRSRGRRPRSGGKNRQAGEGVAQESRPA
mmetsp:Transcript_18233/g.59501  ORF Transcript_18233/g.59501 Transcript_18233/m.59501 type:complete len:121 (+) Transcript_18233:3-365(+)